MTVESLHNKIDELYHLYKDDDYMNSKLTNIIINELPNTLINIQKLFVDRETRKIHLQEAHDLFVSQFINNNKYFYNNTSEIFFNYDGEHYTIIKEDTIIYNILSQLRNKNELLPWKFKIKTSIIKNIKEIPILNSLPESQTIQNVQNILMKIFETKNEVKYFLTIIGDIVLKKNDNNINIISNNSKSILRTIENIGSQYFGHISLSNQFKFKYHDHNYNDCRILITNNEDETHDIILKNIIDIIGNTPIVKLNKICNNIKSELYVKLEYLNPGGSIKDRMGVYICQKAQEKGEIKPGGIIIESTSGNTGVGIAIFSAINGYKCIFVMADKQSKEKINNLRAYGAKVIVCPTNVEPEDPKSYYSVAAKLAKLPNSIYLDQYSNLDNSECHYKQTGPEIFKQTEGKFDTLVASIGTGGTISGCSKYLGFISLNSYLYIKFKTNAYISFTQLNTVILE